MDTPTRKHPSLPIPIQGEMRLERSNQLLAEAQRLVPGVTQSMMKRPEHVRARRLPGLPRRGEGALVEDVDGQEYIDFICGLGANMLGHQHPAVVESIRAHLDEGVLHSLPTPVEVTRRAGAGRRHPRRGDGPLLQDGRGCDLGGGAAGAPPHGQGAHRHRRLQRLARSLHVRHARRARGAAPSTRCACRSSPRPDEAALLTAIEQNAQQLAAGAALGALQPRV